jgi:hypothetical protein
VPVTDSVSLITPCVCVLAWLFLLTREGEAARLKLPRFGEEREGLILSQLDAMNATLMKAAGK